MEYNDKVSRAIWLQPPVEQRTDNDCCSWPEQDAIWNWLGKHGFTRIPREDVLELCEAVTKYRVLSDNKVRALESQLKAEQTSVNELSLHCQRLEIQLEGVEERCSDLSSKLIEARVFITGIGDEIRDHIKEVLGDKP